MTAKVERLVNLTIALLEARAPMTLSEIRRRTGYYQADNPESARRTFERDKDELRRLGIPIETGTAPMSDEVGYRIPRRAYELPDVALTAEEVASLALAVDLTGTPGTPLALAKLAARSPDPAPLPGPVATHVDLRADAVDAVAEAVLSRRVLRFTYRAADGSTSLRTLDPFGVVQRRGAWYLVGRDHGRDALRAFRLDRCLATPTPVGEPGAFDAPAELDLAAAVSGQQLPGVHVELAVSPAARWAVELRGGRDTGRRHHGWAVLALDGLHPVRDRAFLLGLGAEVVVLTPASLHAELEAAYRRVLAVHDTEVVG
ncbi:MAG: helix-turn-helix transcriptional regulator [Nitriliruptoraceae bacterium]